MEIILVIILVLIINVYGQDNSSNLHQNGHYQGYQFPNHNPDQLRNPNENQWNYNTQKRNDAHLPQSSFNQNGVKTSEAHQPDPYRQYNPNGKMEIQYGGRAGAWNNQNGAASNTNQQRNQNWGPEAGTRQNNQQNNQYRPSTSEMHSNQYSNPHLSSGFNTGYQYNGKQQHNPYHPYLTHMNNGGAGNPMTSGMVPFIDPDLPDGLDDLWEMQQKQQAVQHMLQTNPGLAEQALATSRKNGRPSGPQHSVSSTQTGGSGRVRIWTKPVTEQSQKPAGSRWNQGMSSNAPFPSNVETYPVQKESLNKEPVSMPLRPSSIADFSNKLVENQMPLEEKKDMLGETTVHPILQQKQNVQSHPFIQPIPAETKTTDVKSKINQGEVTDQSTYRSRWIRKRGRSNRLTDATTLPPEHVQKPTTPKWNVNHQSSQYNYQKIVDSRYKSMTHEQPYQTTPAYQHRQYNSQRQNHDNRQYNHDQTGLYSQQDQRGQNHGNYEQYSPNKKADVKISGWDPRQKPSMAEYEDRNQERNRIEQQQYNNQQTKQDANYGREIIHQLPRAENNGYQNNYWRQHQMANISPGRFSQINEATTNQRPEHFNQPENDEMEGKTKSSFSRQSSSSNLQNEPINDAVLRELIAERLKQRGQARNNTMPWDPIPEGGVHSNRQYTPETPRAQEGRQTSYFDHNPISYNQNPRNGEISGTMLQEIITDRIRQRRIGNNRNHTLPWKPVQEVQQNQRQHNSEWEYEHELDNEGKLGNRAFSMRRPPIYDPRTRNEQLDGTILKEAIASRTKTERSRTNAMPWDQIPEGGSKISIKNTNQSPSDTRWSHDHQTQTLNEEQLKINGLKAQESVSGGWTRERSKVNATKIPSITGRDVWIDPANQKEIETGRISTSVLDEIIDSFLLRGGDELETPYGKIELEESGGYEIEGPLFRMILAEIQRKERLENWKGKGNTAKELEHLRKLSGFDLSIKNSSLPRMENSQNTTKQRETTTSGPLDIANKRKISDERHLAIWDSLPGIHIPSTEKPNWVTLPESSGKTGRQVWNEMKPWDPVTNNQQPWDIVTGKPASPWEQTGQQNPYNPLFESKISSNKKNSSGTTKVTNTISQGSTPKTEIATVAMTTQKTVATQQMTTTTKLNLHIPEAPSSTQWTHILFEEPLILNKTKPAAARMVWVPNDENEANNTKTENDIQTKKTAASESSDSTFGIIIALFAVLAVLVAPVLCILWRIHKHFREKKRKAIKENDVQHDKFEMEAMISHDLGKSETPEKDQGARRKTNYFHNYMEKNIHELQPMKNCGRSSPTVIVHQVNEIY